MDGNRFDNFTKSLAGVRSRRSLLRLIGRATGVATLASVGFDQAVGAAACRQGGQICRKHDDCCSGNCLAKDATGRQKCALTFTCSGEGTACAPPNVVSNGTTICCNGYCVANNTLNCGACGNTCAAGETCCKPAFFTSNTARECADLQASESHCGACGNVCQTPAIDQCFDPQFNGQVCCNGQCVANDNNNCKCEGPCPGPFPNATVTCIAECGDIGQGTYTPGGCSFDCQAGFEDCDGDHLNGCERVVPPLSDQSCGLDNCSRQPCAPGKVCVPCGTDGAGICCDPGQACGPDPVTGQCGACVPSGGVSCDIDPGRSARFIR